MIYNCKQDNTGNYKVKLHEEIPPLMWVDVQYILIFMSVAFHVKKGSELIVI